MIVFLGYVFLGWLAVEMARYPDGRMHWAVW